jgi:hypothetical protein
MGGLNGRNNIRNVDLSFSDIIHMPRKRFSYNLNMSIEKRNLMMPRILLWIG